MACGTVKSQVSYLKRLPLYQKEKPFQLFIPIDKEALDQRTTNLDFETKERTFVDVRDTAYSCSLDVDGFQLQSYPTKLDLPSFLDRSIVESQYFSEVEEILKNIEGGYDKLFIFDWRIRSSATPRMGNEFDMNDLTTWLRPSPTVHVGWAMLITSPKRHGEPVTGKSPSGQVEFPTAICVCLLLIDYSVWRPLEHVVEDYPLAFCDPESISADDLVECDHVRRKFKGATLYAHFNDTHKWSYIGNHRPDEVLLMKMFDSDTSVKARRLAHASFRHPAITEHSKPRKSIEVRALVFNFPGTGTFKCA
ncbi:hypothetical protein JX265_005342 [Neoarthrinium moseri]|uniref:Uncharacterized protein n=1 Tax=Neoarthrinium moseri TaxID=1658444 RepID=A0A9P9WP23_9PEZI|nr:uncharacterized protein JN550_006201 [Neoarthrinium moseri]KAI1845652.1 hypothetical protein JX266_008263 [Neoarthrinium moseri]KAI1868626.1 hypothetical protein JN550_006201 [Neoarthrinium moseri]KAI1872462.1 hypothetical protein JX265_005342 [Neoarthrinium moseri]